MLMKLWGRCRDFKLFRWGFGGFLKQGYLQFSKAQIFFQILFQKLSELILLIDRILKQGSYSQSKMDINWIILINQDNHQLIGYYSRLIDDYPIQILSIIPMWWFPESWATPSQHPFQIGIFHEIIHPFWVLPFYRNP